MRSTSTVAAPWARATRSSGDVGRAAARAHPDRDVGGAEGARRGLAGELVVLGRLDRVPEARLAAGEVATTRGAPAPKVGGSSAASSTASRPELPAPK